MVKRLSGNIVYVSGATNSAIYDFKNQKVYAINDYGTKILNDYFNNCLDNSSDMNFIDQIKKLFEINELSNDDYIFDPIPKKNLEFVWLEVTQKCQCRCIHCYEGNVHKECDNPLSFEEWKSVIDELAIMNCKEIRFIGGEPTIYKRLYQLIDYAKVKGIEKISLFSNLFNISDVLLKSIIDNDVEVHFSIYASDSKIHDLITQVPGSFNNLINNIKLLSKSLIKLTAHVVIIKENENEVDNIYNLLSDLGINSIKYDEFRKVYGVCNNKHAVTKSRIDNKKPNFKTSKKQFESNNYRNTCWYGKCVVSSNGDIFPCEMERNYLYGNIRENNISNIISSNCVDDFWYWDFSKIDSCNVCEFRFACKDCRPLAYAENGSMKEKNPRCKYDPIKGIWD